MENSFIKAITKAQDEEEIKSTDETQVQMVKEQKPLNKDWKGKKWGFKLMINTPLKNLINDEVNQRIFIWSQKNYYTIDFRIRQNNVRGLIYLGDFNGKIPDPNNTKATFETQVNMLSTNSSFIDKQILSEMEKIIFIFIVNKKVDTLLTIANVEDI